MEFEKTMRLRQIYNFKEIQFNSRNINIYIYIYIYTYSIQAEILALYVEE
jgi:hypothetical protein